MNDHALEYHLMAYKYSEEINDLRNLAKASNSIGIIYNILRQTDTSNEYFLKSLEIEKERGNNTGIAINLAAIGWNYEIEGNYEKTLEYYYKSLEVNRNSNNTKGISIMLTDIGKVLKAQGSYTQALAHYNEAITVLEQINDKRHITQNLLFKGEVLTDLKRYHEALVVLKKAYDLGIEQSSPGFQINALYRINRLYERKGEMATAYAYYKQANQLEDSLFTSKSNDKLLELQTQFESEKKEKENLLLKKNNEIQDQKIKNQQLVNIGIVGILLLVIGVVVILLVSRKRLKYANNLLKEKNEEINQQNEEILVQSENLHEANTKIQKQNDELAYKNNQITNNINYAKRIQLAALPSSRTGNKIPFEHFIMFKPRDIVSGDFYWILQTQKNLIFATADCTGHGVSGGFLSMLGISFLNEIVLRKEITKASHVLDALRNRFKLTLGQTGDFNETKDGMDISLCVIDNQTRQLQFAGANNHAYLYRNNELTLLKADKQPIGVYYKEKPFTNHDLQLKPNDVLYMFSDGFPDQFGEETGHKYMISKFRDLLGDIHQMPLNEQHVVLENNFETWKGQTSQTDDVIVMGIRF